MRLLLIIFYLSNHLLVLSQHRYDVIINEIMVDPSPPVGLPNVEYVELKNTSGTTFNLIGWQLTNDEQTGRITSDFLLSPDSFVILCASSSVRWMKAFGSTISISNFTALNNDKALLSLALPSGVVIHAISFNNDWYQNVIKKLGGWSIEMIDPKYACAGQENWKASSSGTGGSPGKQNSVNGIIQDILPGRYVNAYAPDSSSLLLEFDKPLDSTTSVFPKVYTASEEFGHPTNVIVLPPFYNQVVLQFQKQLTENKLLSISINGLKDCLGKIPEVPLIQTGLSSGTGKGDLVINEVMFNPKPAATDYIEIYNRSSKIIDLKKVYLAGRSLTGGQSAALKISPLNKLLLPGNYCLLTEQIRSVKHHYLTRDPSSLLELNALPSMPDDEGTVIILNEQGWILDELHYEEDWHFPLLNNKEGISLERISTDALSQNPNNWHSASSSVGFGTPGYRNSKAYQMPDFDSNFKIEPEIFSPDNNGVDDYATILYRFASPGYVLTLTIFNISGIPVRIISKNQLCGMSGSFRWDGLDEQNNRLSTGIYILLIECFNLEGKKLRYKKTITLAGNK